MEDVIISIIMYGNRRVQRIEKERFKWQVASAQRRVSDRDRSCSDLPRSIERITTSLIVLYKDE